MQPWCGPSVSWLKNKKKGSRLKQVQKKILITQQLTLIFSMVKYPIRK